MKTIGIVPDNSPNDDATIVEIPDDISFDGRWYDVALRLNDYIPEGWHLVSLNPEKQ